MLMVLSTHHTYLCSTEHRRPGVDQPHWVCHWTTFANFRVIILQTSPTDSAKQTYFGSVHGLEVVQLNGLNSRQVCNLPFAPSARLSSGRMVVMIITARCEVPASAAAFWVPGNPRFPTAL